MTPLSKPKKKATERRHAGKARLHRRNYVVCVEHRGETAFAGLSIPNSSHFHCLKLFTV